MKCVPLLWIGEAAEPWKEESNSELRCPGRTLRLTIENNHPYTPKFVERNLTGADMRLVHQSCWYHRLSVP